VKNEVDSDYSAQNPAKYVLDIRVEEEEGIEKIAEQESDALIEHFNPVFGLFNIRVIADQQA